MEYIHVIQRSELEDSDHIYVWRLGYSHHGIWDGSKVIHYASPFGTGNTKQGAVVRRDSLDIFLNGGQLRRYLYNVSDAEWFLKLRGTCSVKKSDAPSVVLKRAKSLIGQGNYDFFRNNCEHFALWCKLGQRCTDVPNQSTSAVINAVWAVTTPIRGLGLFALNTFDSVDISVINNAVSNLVSSEHAQAGSVNDDKNLNSNKL